MAARQLEDDEAQGLGTRDFSDECDIHLAVSAGSLVNRRRGEEGDVRGRSKIGRPGDFVWKTGKKSEDAGPRKRYVLPAFIQSGRPFLSWLPSQSSPANASTLIHTDMHTRLTPDFLDPDRRKRQRVS
jgi:hypothetical protein